MPVRPRFTAGGSQGIASVQGGPASSQITELSFTLISLVVDRCRLCDCNVKRLRGAHPSPLHSSPGASRQRSSSGSCESWSPLVTVHTLMRRVCSSSPSSMNIHKHGGAGRLLRVMRALFCQLNRSRMTHECQHNHNMGNLCAEPLLNFHEVTYPQRELAYLRVGETTRRRKKPKSQSILRPSRWLATSSSQRHFVAVLLIC